MLVFAVARARLRDILKIQAEPDGLLRAHLQIGRQPG
jgi:hypothetical protein